MTRSDSDSWDLASSVGATATMVAAQRALATTGPDKLINDPFAAPLVRAVGIDFFTRMVDGDIAFPEGDDFDPVRMGHGMGVRTRFFDEHFQSATQGGIRQAVILAAGLDSRAYRLAWPAGTVVYEVDLPQVIDFKTTTLAGLGAEPTTERRTVAVDLRDDWPAALRAAGFDPQAPTVWSAEGLLVYLQPDAQDTLFDTITGLSAPGSRLACEFIQDTSVFSGPEWREHREKLQSIGCEVEIGELIYHGERNHIVDYLTAAGWTVAGRQVTELYAEAGLEYGDDPLAVAFGDLTYLSAELPGPAV
ncbi:putative S-adenosyl-L-methionine-dependent methyltransferase [Mycolicibacter terrae]|uniref:S-adenosyl-L-methionine-dependent methyltransferase n=1 Tax=Mycolicibacter terrae TaxID=1788 RepID=A0AAD1HZU8_9MYCO|nr:class I SAM-dependent methyltransferase [Mycolicibacter terrae]ORW98278.1 SAM-dependent methyltransferase [Mycolicibacter terrae]BBX23899.1 putative S-adenosyl-L-methionine-dependent methyltransferase [Mycolicibacter terrae]SNV58612.1 O-methyltransferase [Mycolicibacter terrae]